LVQKAQLVRAGPDDLEIGLEIDLEIDLEIGLENGLENGLEIGLENDLEIVLEIKSKGFQPGLPDFCLGPNIPKRKKYTK
jgi:hypothetical protein